MKQHLILLIVAILTTSCSSTNKIIYPSVDAIDKQEATLRQIYIGQSIKELSSIIPLQSYHHFEVLEDKNSYLYLNYNNYETNNSYGLYFMNGKLISVISEKDSVTLFACRTMFKTNGEHWLNYGVQPYSNWLIERNTLNKDFNYRAHKPSRSSKSKSHQTAEGIATLVAYSPLLVIGSPFIIYSWASGGMEEDETKQQKKITQRELAASITLGTKYQTITDSLGYPNRTDTVNHNLSLSYFELYYTYGINDGDIVIWKESTSMHELFQRQRKLGDILYGDEECGSLDELWRRK